MTGQLIDNWDEHYEGNNSPPWEDGIPNTAFTQFVMSYYQPGMAVLELGSGLGDNALHLADHINSLLASDISNNAVQRLRERAAQLNSSLCVSVLDILNPAYPADSFDLIFDKGCFHSFFNESARSRVAQNISQLLKPNGLWLSSIGSADNLDDANDPYKNTYPRLSLNNIAISAEPSFEILQVRQGQYGRTDERKFKTWECAFKKRNI